MTRPASRPSPHNISRRDLFLGRLWKVDGNSNDARRLPSAVAAPRKRLQAMRYPKSLADVAIVDDAIGNVTSQSAPPPSARITSATVRRRLIPVHRPPGAIEESVFINGCTRCEACINACPHDAIFHAPVRLREAAGTPIIDADRQPCLMCADFPCIAACEPGVLCYDGPVMMGTARVTEQLCLPYGGTSCTVCLEHCPVDGAIIFRDQKPIVNEINCTGCGVCRATCPAPENAILLMPTFVRPSPA